MTTKQNTQVWAFNKPKYDDDALTVLACQKIYESVKAGKSRFGWSYADEHNLKNETWSKEHPRQMFLLRIKPGDWIVHISVPTYGRCIAAQVIEPYGFDEGVPELSDFRHYFSVDPKTIQEFDRNDPNVLKEVNLAPRGRQQRVLEVESFLTSLDNLKTKKIKLEDGERISEHQLKEKSEDHLKAITELIQKTHPKKELEYFMCKVLKQMSGIENASVNGSGWGTDHGADIIVDTKPPRGLPAHKIIVQVKSYKGTHRGTDGVGQIKTGIQQFDGHAGLLMTTGSRTEELTRALKALAEEIGKPVEALCGIELARFIMEHAPDLVFGD